MRITINRTDEHFAMTATNEEGVSLQMDGAQSIGGHNTGMRPMQMLLAAVGGCSAIDVLMILKKYRQQVDALEVIVDGTDEKVSQHSEWRKVHLHFNIAGPTDRGKVEKAISMSLDKYCSVAMLLNHTASITTSFTLH